MSSLLKFITCGSVDDGKSTLIGHILYNSKLLYTDQVQALELASKVGSSDGDIDYALLLDGLVAEREQGITIDVAYRYFNTDKRSFIVADCPGHEQYTRNMAVGASFADLAIILVDATKGISSQTKRHTMICTMMGIKSIILAVNKMDLVHFDQHKFDEIKRSFLALASSYKLDFIETVPISAKHGDNITEKSFNMPWYTNKSILGYLETVEIDKDDQIDNDSFLLPVQRVSRPNTTFRGFQGEINVGEIHVGDEITVLPNKNNAIVKQIIVAGKDVPSAKKGQPVSMQLDKEIDVSRGSVIYKNIELENSHMFNANILWMDDTELVEGKNYIMKCGTTTIPANLMKIKYKTDINTGQHLSSSYVYKNDIVNCDLVTNNKFVFNSFEKNRTLGCFILIDRLTNMTAACGTINFSLRRANNIVEQELDITRELRANLKDQKPVTIWFTGLSGAGKSTIANALEKYLYNKGKHTVLLDGDNIRLGINKDLGFKEKDRIENIRRVSEIAKLMNDAGLICLSALISPFEKDRQDARKIIGDNYIEIYVNTPLDVVEQRDIKGFYKKAREGEIPSFTGITSPYEPPLNPDIVIDTSKNNIEDAVDTIMAFLENKI